MEVESWNWLNYISFYNGFQQNQQKDSPKPILIKSSILAPAPESILSTGSRRVETLLSFSVTDNGFALDIKDYTTIEFTMGTYTKNHSGFLCLLHEFLFTMKI